MTKLVDLHVHPSLKMYYLPHLRYGFHALVYSGAHWNPLSFRTRYSNLNGSDVKLMMNAHYVIESGFIRHGIVWFARALGWTFIPKWFNKLENSDPYESVLGQMDVLEKGIKRTNRFILGKKSTRLKLVTRPEQIDEITSGEIGIVHTIEGAHALGYQPEEGQSLDEFWEVVKERLAYLKERGVSMITLAHFWDNPFVPQTDGTELIPKKEKGKLVAGRDDLFNHMKRARWVWGDKNKLSEKFTRKLLEMGILIDISHVQEHARQKIYDLCEEYKRPLVASHVGLQHFFNHEYNMSDSEIRRIHKLGGIMGLIFSNRILVDPIKRYKDNGEGIQNIVDNVLYIKNMVGDVSSIGIGTDFDGLTHPFTDLHKYPQLPRLVEALSQHLTDDEIDQIFQGNALRVLRNGWK